VTYWVIMLTSEQDQAICIINQTINYELLNYNSCVPSSTALPPINMASTIYNLHFNKYCLIHLWNIFHNTTVYSFLNSVWLSRNTIALIYNKHLLLADINKKINFAVLILNPKLSHLTFMWFFSFKNVLIILFITILGKIWIFHFGYFRKIPFRSNFPWKLDFC